MELTVECQKRAEGSKPKALRRSGLLPAVLYGHNGAESVSLTINAKTAETLLKQASINNTLINLSIPDLSWNGKTLLREVQTHPWRNYPYHISFFAVSAEDLVNVVVPLHFVGESVGVKRDGGILDPVLTELELRCTADSIPEQIEINVSNLEIGDALHVHEIVLPTGATAIGEPDRVVVSVLQSRGGGEDAESGGAA